MGWLCIFNFNMGMVFSAGAQGMHQYRGESVPRMDYHEHDMS